MFESLQDRLQGVFQQLSGRGKLSEADVDAALREVRLALLEADVNFKVVKDFVGRVRERAVGVEVTQSLTPAQQVVKIVNEELIATLGEPARLNLDGPTPHVVMLVGLQGSGKTTTASKVAQFLRKANHRPLLVAADTRRPAAIEQLQVLGRQLDIPVHAESTRIAPPQICANAIKQARQGAHDVILLDTAGRLHTKYNLMQELKKVRGVAAKHAHRAPHETLLVLDATTGQNALAQAQHFKEAVDITGIFLAKLDGTAKGGIVFAIAKELGVPIHWVGTGEGLDDLAQFDAEAFVEGLFE